MANLILTKTGVMYLMQIYSTCPEFKRQVKIIQDGRSVHKFLLWIMFELNCSSAAQKTVIKKLPHNIQCKLAHSSTGICHGWYCTYHNTPDFSHFTNTF